jgi:RNA polymerase sigma-70 factor (ECF subfamily)
MAQEAQLQALEQMEGLRFPNRSSFRAWLGRVLTNAVVRRGRRLRLPRAALDGGLAGSGSSPSERLMRDERWENARANLAGLPERQRQIVQLRLWDGLSFEACGLRLGVNETNARVIFHRALARLRKESRPDL